ncbi:uncharacterized protein METZ01_LOCUS68512, partial [marine metagenome]
MGLQLEGKSKEVAVRRVIIVVVVLALLGAGAFYYFRDKGGDVGAAYRLGEVTKGPMEVLVS